MARKKVKLAFVSDSSARKATFNKRKKGIIKKVSELTVLCGIPACAIITSPFDSQTEVWPDLEGAKQVIESYQNTNVIDESKNVNQESFMMQRIDKANEQLKKMIDENHEKELSIAMIGLMRDKNLPFNLTAEELKEFDKLADKKLKEIDNKLVSLMD